MGTWLGHTPSSLLTCMGVDMVWEHGWKGHASFSLLTCMGPAPPKAMLGMSLIKATAE